MNAYEYFYNLGCFTREDVLKLAENPKNADSIIYTQKKKGNISSVKRNLYIAISRETKMPTVTPFEIGSKITNDAYISHHSAFEYYGISNQVFSGIYVSTQKRFNDFDYDGKIYKFVSSKCDMGIVSPTHRVRVTDIERTIVDSIKDFTKIGGLEELLRCLTMVTFADENKLLVYLKAYGNQFLYQKSGYILSHYQKSMKISNAFFEKCITKKKASVRYLYDEIKIENPIFNSKWQLFVPADLMKLIDEGGEAIV